MADIGCGDGDFAMLFAHWGAAVDAVDYAETNFNRMQGAEVLRGLLGARAGLASVDLDERFELPREVYGLALFLGTLYHLKNPYGVLERLAYRAHWCVLSTRVAQVTPKAGARIGSEPVAYLADGREIEGDATNYWILSPAGLLRILQRTRWAIAGVVRAGCRTDSNPVCPDADERMFVLAKSRVFYPALAVRLLDGWHAAEGDFRWTAGHFSIELVLPLERPVKEFAMQAHFPEAVLARGLPVRLLCRIGGELVGCAERRTAGAFEFRGALPPAALHEPVLRLDFAVESSFSASPGDARELGVCVALQNSDSRIAFQVFE